MKRILIISNNCLSKGGSNGRTIDNLIHAWKADKVAQFYIHNSYPDSAFCENFFRITDVDALKSIWQGQKGQIINSKLLGHNESVLSLTSQKKKNPLRMLLRELVWSLRRWEGVKFNNWLDSFGPEVVFFQVGDNSFMIKIAIRIAKRFKIPLVVFNSEGYFFQEESYMKNSTKFSNLFYSFFIKQYRKSFKEMMDYCSHTLYLSEVLQEIYSKRFFSESSVIYTPSDFTTYPYKEVLGQEGLVFSYIGNLGHNRHIPLIEIAEKLILINKNSKLNVYGPVPSNEAKVALLSCNGLDYKGVVSYSKVNEIIKNSDVLLHVESSDPKLKEILKFGFSTKIADSLMSGRLFILYAPNYVACAKYMLEELPTLVATNSDELEILLNKVTSDSQFRYEYSRKGVELAEKNHSFAQIKQKFSEVINFI